MKRILDFIKKRQEIIIPLLLFILSIFLRTFRLPEFIAYHQDQVRDLTYIAKVFQEHEVILLGPKASVGNFYLAPLWYYLMSVAYFFSKSPLAPALMVAVLNSLATIFIYFFVRDFFSKKLAIYASLLYAVSPFSIEYSRFAWNPNPIPLFAIISIYCLFMYLFKQKKNFIYLSVAAANLVFQLHYQGFLLVAAVFIFPILRKDWKRLFGSFVIFILMLSPFFIFEVINNFPNSKEILTFLMRTAHGKSLGITNSFKALINDYPVFIGRSLFFGFFPLGLIFAFISYLIVIKNGIDLFKKNFFKSEVKVLYFIFLILLLTLFLYRQWIVPYYLLVMLIPLIIVFTVFFQRFPILFLLIIVIDIFYSPAFVKTDSSYLFFKKSVSMIEKAGSSKDCVKVVNKDPDLDFTNSAVSYLMTLDRYNPQSTDSCQNKFIFCEKSLCDKIIGVKKLDSNLLNLELIEQ